MLPQLVVESFGQAVWLAVHGRQSHGRLQERRLIRLAVCLGTLQRAVSVSGRNRTILATSGKLLGRRTPNAYASDARVLVLSALSSGAAYSRVPGRSWEWSHMPSWYCTLRPKSDILAVHCSESSARAASSAAWSPPRTECGSSARSLGGTCSKTFAGFKLP